MCFIGEYMFRRFNAIGLIDDFAFNFTFEFLIRPLRVPSVVGLVCEQ